MACQTLKQKIYNVLKAGAFSDTTDLVDVSDGFEELIHVVVVSRKFDGKPWIERRNLIWTELFKHLSPEEWGLISLAVNASPEEIKFL